MRKALIGLILFKFRILGALPIVLLLLVSGAASAFAQVQDSLVDVRFGVNGKGQTRIVLDLEGNAAYRVYTREVNTTGKALSIELSQVKFRIGGEERLSGTNNGIGHVGTYAYRLGEDGRSRLIFDLKQTAVPTSVFMLKPKNGNSYHRLVIDLNSGSEADFKTSLGQVFGALGPSDAPAGIQAAEATSTSGSVSKEATAIERAERAALAEERQKLLLVRAPIPRIKPDYLRRLIVIDPGHGGKDPGAIGPTGVQEKNVVLAASKQLRELLKARGYKVILTRDGDTYPELEERIEKAREEQADLFLSIHADAAPSANIRGASVYTLSDKGSDRLANQVSTDGNFVLHDKRIQTVSAEVGEILVDLATTESRNESSKFANQVVNNLTGLVPMVNNVHREASFVVLLSPDVPAVLLEMAFISNAEDEKNVNSKPWRQKVMVAVAESIDEYFDSRERVRHAMNDGAR